MDREQRWKYVGTVFYLVFAASLLLTNKGIELTSSFLSSSTTYGPIIVAIGIIVGFLTSGQVGYIFNTLYVCYWNFFRGGYNAELEKLTYNLKDELIKQYETNNRTLNGNLKKYGLNVFLSYFWQQEPGHLIDWVARRYTIYFVNMVNIFGIILALVISWSIIWWFNMGPNLYTIVILVASIIFIRISYYNAHVSKEEASQMLDVWVFGVLDPKMNESIKKFKGLTPSENKMEEKQNQSWFESSIKSLLDWFK